MTEAEIKEHNRKFKRDAMIFEYVGYALWIWWLFF